MHIHIYAHTVHVCVMYVHVCVDVCIYAHTHTCTSGAQRLASGVFIYILLIYLGVEQMGHIVELCLAFSNAFDILEIFRGVIDI